MVLMLGALLAMIRRHALAFVLPMVLIPLLAFVAIQQTRFRYTAASEVMYDPSGYAARELQSILRDDPITDAVIASQLEIVQSLPMAERLIDRFDLMRKPEFNAALRHPTLLHRVAAAALGTLAPTPPNPQTEHQAVARTVLRAIEAKPVRTSRLMEISFSAEDPFLAADGANALAEFYIADQLAVKAEAVHRADAWLDARVADLRREVRADEDRIAAYRARHGLVQGVQAGLDTEQISHLGADLVQARTGLADAEARLEAARGRGNGGAQATVAPSVVALRAQEDQLSALLQATLARLGPGHPAAIALDSQVAGLRLAVETESARVAAAIEAEVAADRGRVAALERDLRKARAEVDRNARSQVPLNAMLADAEAARGLLQTVLERMQQTVRQTALEMPDARLVSAAMPPDKPSSPKTLLMIAGAGVAGVFLGLLFVYLREMTDGTFRSGQEVRSMLTLPCLALIPEVGRGALGRGRVQDYVADKPLSPFSEQFRALRAALWVGGAQPRVVAITAARPAEGKTTIALALGRSAALSGERVIVLDCDVRQPSFGRLMQADSAIGVIDCLLGHVTLDDIIRTDELTGLDYIPAGSAEANSLSLFRSDAMAGLLERLRRDYALVLLDAPPAFAMADARVLASVADATLLCVRWRDTPRGIVRNSLDILADAQAKVVGVALTRVDARAHGRSGFADAEVYHARHGGYFRE